MIQFDLPKEQSSIIKVIGVGGGGSNAVNHMYSQSIGGVDFIICNTDAQAVQQSNVPNKIQLGPALTEGLGAGANPSIGKQATEESLEEIRKILEVNTKMVFITAGMGGGTGTGGAPIVAKMAKEMGILTVGIVTTPFGFEGKKRKLQAEEGIMQLKEHVDTLLVISNDKVRHQYGNLKIAESFAKADNVLATAAKCITDVINTTGQINVDFADVKTVMQNGGVAILGSAVAEGEDRALTAIETAINSPLLNDNDIHGAAWILININSAEGDHEFTMDEVDQIHEYMISKAGEGTDVITGLGYDNTLGEGISVTLIATGFQHKDPFPKAAVKPEPKDEKVFLPLNMPESKPAPIKKTEQPTLQFQDDKIPAPAKAETIQLQEVKPVEDVYQPTLRNDAIETKNETPESENTDDSTPVFYEISSAQDQKLVIEFDMDMPVEKKVQQPVQPVAGQNLSEDKTKQGFLSKPSQLYVAERNQERINEKAQPEITQVVTQAIHIKEEESAPELSMTLTEKPLTDTAPAKKDNPIPQQQAIADDTEELRNRAMKRIEKLRNLSFNINSGDAHSEYENVPAYLRRNVELHGQIADVENFYSNYSVKNDDNPQPDINTIGTFLDGKKPD